MPVSSERNTVIAAIGGIFVFSIGKDIATGNVPKPQKIVAITILAMAFALTLNVSPRLAVSLSLLALIAVTLDSGAIVLSALTRSFKTPGSFKPDAPVTAAPVPQAPTAGGFGGQYSYPLGKHGAIIGTPHNGSHTLGNWESDNAVDIAVPCGTPVYAVTAGRIGSQLGSLGANPDSRFAGIRLHLVTSRDEFYYAHLSSLAMGIIPGVSVKAGQYLGRSGSANGTCHLHIANKSDTIQSVVGSL